MSLTFDEAEDSILKTFYDAWEQTGFPVDFPNVKDENIPPSANTPWSRISLNYVNGNQSLADNTGKTRFERSGLITVQVFAPAGEGLSRINNLVSIVSNAFEAKQADGVWYINTRPLRVGISGDFYQINVLSEFRFTEIK